MCSVHLKVCVTSEVSFPECFDIVNARLSFRSEYTNRSGWNTSALSNGRLTSVVSSASYYTNRSVWSTNALSNSRLSGTLYRRDLRRVATPSCRSRMWRNASGRGYDGVSRKHWDCVSPLHHRYQPGSLQQCASSASATPWVRRRAVTN